MQSTTLEAGDITWRKQDIRETEDNVCLNYRHRGNSCGYDRRFCGRRLMQDLKEISHNSSKSPGTQWPTWRQREQDKEATCCVEVKKFFMARSHLSHQNQTPGHLTMQIFPAVKPCWTRRNHIWVQPPCLESHTLSSALAGGFPGVPRLGEGNIWGFFSKIPSSCLTLYFLLTAHQDCRAESSRDLSSLNFYSCFCF